MKVRITLAAEVAIDELDDWWREHRPKSHLAIAEEAQRIIKLLQDSPYIGKRYDAELYPTVRRCRLRTTPYYLYYEVDASADELVIVAARSAKRDEGPSF